MIILLYKNSTGLQAILTDCTECENECTQPAFKLQLNAGSDSGQSEAADSQTRARLPCEILRRQACAEEAWHQQGQSIRATQHDEVPVVSPGRIDVSDPYEQLERLCEAANRGAWSPN